ncbi:hypothetical protein CSV61_05855 [Sporosarcina sp. P3]|nr:hypothetical protein CSV61_05855 [Sporosarcina sp. P3]
MNSKVPVTSVNGKVETIRGGKRAERNSLLAFLLAVMTFSSPGEWREITKRLVALTKLATSLRFKFFESYDTV